MLFKKIFSVSGMYICTGSLLWNTNQSSADWDTVPAKSDNCHCAEQVISSSSGNHHRS